MIQQQEEPNLQAQNLDVQVEQMSGELHTAEQEEILPRKRQVKCTSYIYIYIYTYVYKIDRWNI
jgi:hypothetical protein